ncbi:MAG: PSD1 and planctomycete cytochrome C domain-containing protein [Isosphaeraceae bacterium]
MLSETLRLSGGCSLILATVYGFLSASALAAEPPVDFSRDILPILSDHCFQCHGPDARARKGDLRLDTKADALRATDPVIVPGKSDESELIARVVTREPDEVMPPPKTGKALNARQVELLRRWVDAGARWGEHWSFAPLRRPAVPTVQKHDWPTNPIDAFILARIETEGLAPSPDADWLTLLRRLSLDLTGLPPAPDLAASFAADRSPQAVERLIDRLLASPRFGERHAWDWLDAARYADSNGYQGDSDRTMWPWRDWVVDALNRNLSFDAFTTWQLAGDLLPNASKEQVLATAFCRNHMINGEGGRIAEENRVDYVMDMTETTATVWLGLTFNCARCHNHKFDPFTQRDYYALFALFNQTPVDGGGGNPQTSPTIDVSSPAQAALGARLDRRHREAASAVAAIESRVFPRPQGRPASDSPVARAAGLSAEAVKALGRPPFERNRAEITALTAAAARIDRDYQRQLAALRQAVEASENFLRGIPRVMVMADRPNRRDTFILTRGSYEKPGEKVDPATPAALPGLAADSPRNRLGLARWLTSRDNPLTARVTVNRIWQTYFGAGLVKTPEDLGVQGEHPSHPELLDWLAAELVDSGWDVKALIRLIVSSRTYQQASRVSPQLVERDPQNRLLARGARFRMPSWMIRDQALAASGLLSDRLGGPPVHPYQPEGVWEEATFGNRHYPADLGEALYRRSLYTFWRRIVGPTMFFDSAPRQTCVVKPTRTNSPMHALTTLNDVAFNEAARVLAARAMQEKDTTGERIDAMFARVLVRPPKPAERDVLISSYERLRRVYAADPAAAKKVVAVGASPADRSLDPVDHAALTLVGSAILNLDEALTRE